MGAGSDHARLWGSTRRPISATCSTGSARIQRGGSRSCFPTAGRHFARPAQPHRTDRPRARGLSLSRTISLQPSTIRAAGRGFGSHGAVLGVAAPSLRKPTVAYWAQCRGSGPPERRGAFHPIDSDRTRYLAQCRPPGSDPVSLRTIRRLVGEHCAHCELDAIILRNISGCPTDSALLVDVVSPD